MPSAKALYFIAIGVLALGLSHDYREGRLAWAHRYLDRPTAVAHQYSACLRHYVASALMPDSVPAFVEHAKLNRDRIVLSRDQVRLMVDQARMVRREVERHRGEFEQARRVAVERAGAIRVVCPESGQLVVDVPEVHVQIPNIRVNVPQVVDSGEIVDADQ